MSEYKRLNLKSLNFSDNHISYDDATKNKGLPFFTENENIKMKFLEKNFENKCVKLATY